MLHVHLRQLYNYVDVYPRDVYLKIYLSTSPKKKKKKLKKRILHLGFLATYRKQTCFFFFLPYNHTGHFKAPYYKMPNVISNFLCQHMSPSREQQSTITIALATSIFLFDP